MARLTGPDDESGTICGTSPGGPRAIIAVLLLGVAAYALLQSFVTPMLSVLRIAYRTDQATITWALTAYLVSAAVFTPVIGRLGDMVGRKPVLVLTLVIVAAGACMAALASTAQALILARAIQGVGGGILPLSFGVVRDVLPPTKVAAAIGALASTIGVGSGIGIVVAGPISDTLGFRWLFWIPLTMTLIAAVGAHALVPPTPGHHTGRISPVSTLLLSGWLITLLLAVSQGDRWGWGSHRTIAMAVCAAITMAAWATWERAVEHPLIPLTLMRIPAVRTGGLVAALVGVTLYAAYAFVPQFAQSPPGSGYGLAMSASDAGRTLIPASGCMFLASLVAGGIAERLGTLVAVAWGCAATAGAMAAMAFINETAWQVYVVGGVLGAGIGLSYACLTRLVVEAVPAHQTGVATAMAANIMTIGGSVGTAIFSTVVTAATPADGVPRETGYTFGFALLAAAMALAAAAAIIAAARLARGHSSRSIDAARKTAR